MKTIPTLLAIYMLGCGITACGGTSGAPRSSSGAPALANASSRVKPSAGYLKSDGDGDPDDRGQKQFSDDQKETLALAPSPSGAETRAIATMVRNYYAAATDEDGATGCSLLASSLATAISERQVADGGTKTCAMSLSVLFKQQHQRMAAEEPSTMVVTGVHVSGTLGLATLGFRAMPEAQIIIQREGDTWKIDALFDSTVQ